MNLKMKAKYELLSRELKNLTIQMDANYRGNKCLKYTPDEIAQVQKALRMLDLSVGAGGWDECFFEPEVEL